mgnify:FL=1|jgi:hypothetical protein|tara:strand:+ start:429 stop:743 length:315 start_codon:yes stop_codon:yes gene_type:complete
MKHTKISTTKLFNVNGQLVSDENKEEVFGKHVKIEFESGDCQNQFYVMCKGSELYDPQGMDSHRRNLNLGLRKVNQNVFDMYMMYLNTNNKLYFTKSNRSFING